MGNITDCTNSIEEKENSRNGSITKNDIKYDQLNLNNDSLNAKPIEIVDNIANISKHNERKPGINIDNFKILQLLGTGSFGKVFLVQNIETKTLYAMKTVDKNANTKRNHQVLMKQERDIMINIKSPFIVQLHYAFQTKDKLYMVMEYMNGGELFLRLRREKKFNEDKARFYAAEILIAIEHLHTNNIIYRDLKPENVLLDSKGHIKIVDFGLAKKGLTGNEKAYTACGTLEYVAPEILEGTGHDSAVDFWSYGIIIYEMLHGRPPFENKNRQELFKAILEMPVYLRPEFSPEATELLSLLLIKDKTTRQKNIKEIKKMAFFKSLDWEKLEKKEIEPPWKPSIDYEWDTRNFDKYFTAQSIPSSTMQDAKSGNTFAAFTYKKCLIEDNDTDFPDK